MDFETRGNSGDPILTELYSKIHPEIQSILLEERRMGYGRFSSLDQGASLNLARELSDNAVSTLGLERANIGVHFVTVGESLRHIDKDGFKMTQNYTRQKGDVFSIDFWTFSERRGICEMRNDIKDREAFVTFSIPRLKDLSDGSDYSPNENFQRLLIPTQKLDKQNGIYYLPKKSLISLGGVSPAAVATMRTQYAQKHGLMTPQLKFSQVSFSISRTESEFVYGFNQQQQNVYVAHRFVESLALSQIK